MANTLLGLDVGTVRIGIAIADTSVKIAVPYDTIAVDGNELVELSKLVIDESVDTIVIGLPRNQSGNETEQSELVRVFAGTLTDLDVTLVFQDESLTSVQAEDRLKSHRKAYTKEDIDAQAATIILQDYLEEHYG